MSNFPRSPRLHRGAIVIIDAPSATPKTVYFQYNPDSITRTLTPKASKAQGTNAEPFRLEGPPEEDIQVNVEMDATDQLEQPEQNFITVSQGINPQLSALETILYPKSSQVIANAALAMAGTIEIVPPTGALTLFVFGANRVLPVKITKYQITEEAYDTNLNPIRAKVTISMRVLSYADLQQSQMAYSLYQASHIEKEVSAQSASVSSGAGIGSIP
jgi:hypothetical protein